MKCLNASLDLITLNVVVMTCKHYAITDIKLRLNCQQLFLLKTFLQAHFKIKMYRDLLERGRLNNSEFININIYEIGQKQILFQQ